jgi:hypothetical protein
MFHQTSCTCGDNTYHDSLSHVGELRSLTSLLSLRYERVISTPHNGDHGLQDENHAPLVPSGKLFPDCARTPQQPGSSPGQFLLEIEWWKTAREVFAYDLDH